MAKNFHFEQPGKGEETHPQRRETRQRLEFLSKKYEGQTERQLLEDRNHSLNMMSKNISSIKSMVQFFVWMFCLSIAAWIIITIMAME